MNSWSNRTSNIIRGSFLLVLSLFAAFIWSNLFPKSVIVNVVNAAPEPITVNVSVSPGPVTANAGSRPEPETVNVSVTSEPAIVNVSSPPEPAIVNVSAPSEPVIVSVNTTSEQVIVNVNASQDSELSSGTTTPESLNSARQVVETFQQGLITVMQQAKELGFQGRYDQLKSVVENSHDLAGIARIVVGGKQWRLFDEDQKKRLLDTFTRLAIATYAYNFNDYSGESFQFVSEKEAKRGQRLVRTLLTVPKGEDVRFDCVLREKDGRWLIVNIIANGVSDLALKRSEYSSILGQQGFDGLLEKMNGKIEYYAGNKKSET